VTRTIHCQPRLVFTEDAQEAIELYMHKDRRESPNWFEKTQGFASVYWYNLHKKGSLEVFRDAAT